MTQTFPLKPLICHCLVGPPSSGKTTFAKILETHLGEQGQPTQIVSADQIREQLYGDVAIQGAWSDIEPQLLDQMERAISVGKSVIYDATNAYRWWRQSLLIKLAKLGVQWVAWQLTTPLETCLAWNQARDRHVPTLVIQEFAQALKSFPVIPAEGFTAIFTINPALGTLEHLQANIAKSLAALPLSQKNRKNRTQHILPHRYSRLLDFDRLLHLLSLIIRYPGLGNFRHENPEQLLDLLKTDTLPPLLTGLDEIAAVMASQYHQIYADLGALKADLDWLDDNSFFSQATVDQPLSQPVPAPTEFMAHRYSDWLGFQRLFATLRYILHHPLEQEDYREAAQAKNMVDCLAERLYAAKILPNPENTTLRKDIQLVFNPYRLLPDKTLRKGYCLGTGILTEEDLLRVYELAAEQVKGLNDVMAQATVERFQKRLAWAQFNLADYEPVRVIASGSIVSPKFLNFTSLASVTALTDLESYIRSGQKIRIGRQRGSATFDSFKDFMPEEDIWPLEIIFHNIAWYLGYELASGESQGLLRYERLDRLYQAKQYSQVATRTAKQQQRARNQLQKLRRYSAGIFLGVDKQKQQEFLSLSPAQRLQKMVTLKLQFTEALFKFVSEGTQRFPFEQLKMTPPPSRSIHHHSDLKQIFTLGRAADPIHPYRMNVLLPAWSFEDVTLKAWILGFGPGVKVIAPDAFQQIIIQEVQQTQQLYDSAH
ncbi:AAA family ATPase [Thermosynechococcaceae cyanobacterium BACA0444]|uniref:AAA family ATPase n=1 Tax=Pseudocalidococcus azoricus BACA0444 TaxID=2918990 RepID=A0AAE4FVS1_9CYAN|nr:AAA family ATPase [Pseudocalidococcus azoricus]MDS3861835.1 AAA family ATPase [Pseudocalidococcus azoricus BACA0444]